MDCSAGILLKSVMLESLEALLAMAVKVVSIKAELVQVKERWQVAVLLLTWHRHSGMDLWRRV